MNEIICRECHSPNKIGSKFCSNCGASLKAATHIICPNCYHRNPLHLLYCDNCGTRLIKQATAPLTSRSAEPELEPLVSPARGFSLPMRNPGETGDLDPDSLPDWLKTGVEKKAAVPAEDEARLSDWLNELKTTGGLSEVDQLGALNLDWLNEPVTVVEPSPPPPAPPAPTAEPSDEPFEDSDFDWLNAMDDLSTEGETADEASTGFTGWLTADTLPEETATPTQPEENTADWLTDLDNETFTSEESGRTGFTGWLESKKLDPRDVEFEDEFEEDESFAVGMNPLPTTAPRRERENEDLPDWLLNAPSPTTATPSPSNTPPSSSGFTTWLREQDLLDKSIKQAEPSSGGAVGKSEATGFTGWLTEQGLAAEEPASTKPTTASPAPNNVEDELDWLSLERDTAEDEDDPDALRQEMVGTGFTGWLSPSILEQVEIDEQPQATADWGVSSTSRGLPDWLDTGELTPPAEDEAEEEVGTGFTGWLNPAQLETIQPPAPPPTAEPEAPDWLLAGPDEDEESGGTGFTDWLAGGQAEAAEDDDEEDDGFGWLEEEEEEVMPQELMTPLSKEEAHKLLENTPDVSEEFIQEVVEGDFPDWLTDVKNNEDAVSTDVLPAWISAPLSTTDELELGFHPAGSSPKPTAPEEVEDDWLNSLGTAVGSPSLAMGDDSWLTDLGAAKPTSMSNEEDTTWLNDLGLGLEAEAEIDEDDDPFLAPSTAAKATWGADKPTATADDDWLAGLDLGMGLAGGTDLLKELPQKENNQEWDLSGFGTSSLPDLDWLASQEAAEEPIATPLNRVAQEPAPALPAEPDEFAYLLGEEMAPATMAEEDADESNFDWLGALGDEAIEPSSIPALRDRQAWLQGADLEDETDTAASAGSRELDEALQTTVFTSRPKPPQPESSTTDIAQLVSNLREQADTVADEEILSELEALRQPDGLEADLGDYEENVSETAANITGDDLRFDMGVADPSLQQKQLSGPLAGLMGVVPIAHVVGGLVAVPPTASAATQSEQVALMRHITRQNGQAITTNMLDDLLGTPSDAPTAKRRVDWAQVVLGLLLLTAVMGGLLFPNLIATNPPTAAPGLSQLQNQLATLQEETILVVFDYTPALAGELDPSAELLLAQLAQNGNEFVTMSQYPTGMATAASLLEGLPVTGSLGYVPGEALGLRQLAGCLNGQPCGVGNVPHIAAVVVLAGDRDSLQDWMEQVAPQVTQPIWAAVPQAVAPTAQPYLTSGQLDGLLGGLSATAALATNTQASTAAAELRQSQTLAQLLALAILILSPLAALTQRRKK